MSFYADDGVQYIEDHLKEVCQAVDDKIEESSDEIEKQIFDYIREHVMPIQNIWNGILTDVPMIILGF